MKISCDIIRDLLPLYKDNVCSDASKDMVEDHLSVCQDCQEYYEQMNAELPEIVPLKEEGDPAKADWDFFEKISRKLTYRQFIIGSVVAVILLTLYTICTYSAPFIVSAREKVMETVPFLDKRIPVDDVKVQDVYRLENGAIYCSFTVDSYISAFDRQYVVQDEGSPQVDTSASGGNTNGISLQRYWSDFTKAEGYSSSFYFLVPEELSYYREDPVTAEEKLTHQTSDGVYFVGKGGRILPLYEKGESIPDAPADIEAQVQEDTREYSLEEDEWSDADAPDYNHNYCYILSFNEEK